MKNSKQDLLIVITNKGALRIFTRILDPDEIDTLEDCTGLNYYFTTNLDVDKVHEWYESVFWNKDKEIDHPEIKPYRPDQSAGRLEGDKLQKIRKNIDDYKYKKQTEKLKEFFNDHRN